MFALAVIHHLAISADVPLVEFLAMAADLGGGSVFEYPTPDEPRVHKLLSSKRACVRDDHTLEAFAHEIEPRFDVRRRQALPSQTRLLCKLPARTE